MNKKLRSFLVFLLDPRMICSFVLIIGGIWLIGKHTDFDEIRGICCLLASLILLTNMKIDDISKLGKMEERIDKLESYFGDDVNGNNRQ